jgi:hypothetical protein
MRSKIAMLAAVIVAAILIIVLTPSDPPAPSRGARAVAPTHSPARATPPPVRAARPLISPLADRRVAAPHVEVDPQDAERRAALAARGITPRKLYSSRAGGRMTYLGIAARQLGEPALADAAEALGRRMWQAMDPARPEADLDALLVEQADLVARFQDLARQHPENPGLIVHVGQVHEDMVATASGEPRSIDRKLANEEDEGPRHSEIDDDEHKGSDAPPAPE